MKNKFNKKTHFSCKNCRRNSKIEFKNDVNFCFGLVKKPHVPCDKYRFCITKNNSRMSNDIMLEELHCLLFGLSNILFNQRLIEINKPLKK